MPSTNMLQKSVKWGINCINYTVRHDEIKLCFLKIQQRFTKRNGKKRKESA